MERKIVKNITRKREIPNFVYNLRIKDNHNYFANNILVHNCDDPNTITLSEIKRQNTNMWWDQVWSSRLNDPKRDVKIVIQQRVHEKDVTGHIISSDQNKEWVKLILPMEFETGRKCQTVILPSSVEYRKTPWCDPRTKEGELLFSKRFGLKEVNSYKRNLGSYAYAGQYQQRPAPLEGGILQKSWFKKWIKASFPVFEFVIQSWDTAFSDKPDAAYSACTTWGVFYNDDVTNIILLSTWRGRVGYPELRARAKRLYKNYKDTTESPSVNKAIHSVNRCIIEAKATGDPLIRDLKLAGIPAQSYQPRGDKNARVQQIAAYIEAGCVWLPTYKDNSEKLIPWADEFLEIISTFPNTDSRDYVDTLSQILGFLRDNNMMTNPRDPKIPIIENNSKKVYFNI